MKQRVKHRFEPTEESASFVRALYRGFLKRDPDEAGLRHWSEALQSSSCADVLEAFTQGEEVQQRLTSNLFVPPGHFYSPIVDRKEAERHLKKILAKPTTSLSGLSLDHSEIVTLWNRLVPLMQSAPFAGDPGDGLRYGFSNPMYSWGDGAILQALIRNVRPKRLIEIGSGWSSVCAVDTTERFLDGKCELTFIEPYPQVLRELLGREPVRVSIVESRVQDVSPSAFEVLQSGDILLIDSSHVLRTGSDVCYELFEIMPRLSSGVLVHFHDIFWPFEYPHWMINENRSWNEIYAVRAFLTGNSGWRILMFNDYLANLERALIERTYPPFLKNPGGALWIQKQ